MPDKASSPRELVTAFYNAISAADAETVVKTIDAHFADDAWVEWPPSLPHGGRAQGIRKLRAIFSAAADPNPPAGAKNLKLINVFDDATGVAAWISFDWVHPGGGATTPNQALEVWTFVDGQVHEIRAFYWDTAAIAAPST